MEMIINQSILPYKLELRYIEKRWTKSKKWHRRKSPPCGMVNKLERAYSKRLFFLISIDYNISKLKLIHLVLIWNETKGLQIAKIWNFFGRRRPPGGFQMVQKCFPDSASSSFLLHLLKTSKIITVKYSQSTLKVLLDEQTFYPKILS